MSTSEQIKKLEETIERQQEELVKLQRFIEKQKRINKQSAKLLDYLVENVEYTNG